MQFDAGAAGGDRAGRVGEAAARRRRVGWCVGGGGSGGGGDGVHA